MPTLQPKTHTSTPRTAANAKKSLFLDPQNGAIDMPKSRKKRLDLYRPWDAEISGPLPSGYHQDVPKVAFSIPTPTLPMDQGTTDAPQVHSG
jgi:hypothetical protein